jgi:flagellar motor switch protein FliG
MSFGSAQRSDPATLTRKRKAAMIVQLMLTEGQNISLSRLPEDMQMRITRELGALRIVDKDTLRAVVEEFSRDLESVGLAVPGGVASALAALSGQISPNAVARLKSEAAHGQGADPWTQLTDLSAEELIPLMTAESTEVGAVVLSKLPVAKAAELLGRLPGEKARRITYAVSQTSTITPDAVARIGVSLATEYCVKVISAFHNPPVQRVGAILNSSVPATRDALLEGLGNTDAAFAEEVRRAIFTFPDIPARLAAGDVPKVTRGVDQPLLVTALAAALGFGGADAASAEFILKSMSQRMADSLREEIKERGKVKKAEGEGAMGQVVAVIRDRADSGEITLIKPDDPAEAED